MSRFQSLVQVALPLMIPYEVDSSLRASSRGGRIRIVATVRDSRDWLPGPLLLVDVGTMSMSVRLSSASSQLGFMRPGKNGGLGEHVPCLCLLLGDE